MSLPTTHCPDCNSVQRFARRERKVGDTMQVYIRCFACGYEVVLGTYSRSEWLTHKRERVHRLRALRRSIR